jgi:hypothetical protein
VYRNGGGGRNKIRVGVGVAAKEDNLYEDPAEPCCKVCLRCDCKAHSGKPCETRHPSHDSPCSVGPDISLTGLINTAQVTVLRNEHVEFCCTNTLREMNRACV